MSGVNLKLYASQVLNIANEMEKENQNLAAELKHSKEIVENLTTIWKGEAAQTTVDVYNSFYKKYAEQYRQAVDDYVQFLRKNVADGFVQVEQHNKSLADQF